MPRRIQLRRGTAAEWAAANPTLATGEVGLEIDGASRKMKIGPGRWNDLDYWGGEGSGAEGPAGPTGPQGPAGPTGVTGPQGPAGPVAGSSGQVVYNNAGSPAGAASLTIDPATGRVGLGNLSEGVYTISDGPSVDLNPINGPLQQWTLTTNRTPTATNFVNGQSMKLRISGNYTITWPSVVWMGTTPGSSGTAPAAPTTGFLHVELWKESNVLYGVTAGYTAT